MKVLVGKSKLVLFMGVVVSMVMSLGTGHNEDAFSVLCDVLRSAERVLNKTGTQSGTLKEALFGGNNGVLAVEKGQVSVKGACNYQTKRELLCTYYAGGPYGCFAQTLAGAILCTCTPDQRGGNFCRFGALNSGGSWSSGKLENQKDFFQKVWDQVKEKCSYGDRSQPTHTEPLDDLKDALEKVRGNLRQGGIIGGRNAFYLGEANCVRPHGAIDCVAYLGANQDNVPIPWLGAIKKVLSDLKEAPQKVSVLATRTHTAPNPREPEALKDTEVSESEAQNITTEEEHTEDIFSPGTPSPPANPPSPKSRSKRSTTEGHATTSTSPEDTSTTEEPEILDPTAAPFSSLDGTDILTPLGLFMAASSFF